MRRCRGAVPALLALLLARPVDAQEIAGRVVNAAGGTALIGALVSATDSSGAATTVRAITSATGRFRVNLPRSGTWQVKVAAIGFTPAAQFVAVGDSLVTLPTLLLAPSAYALPDIVAAARGSTCARNDLGTPILDRLLREAETALGLVQATIDSRRVEFVSEIWQRRVFEGSTDTIRASSTARSRASWPLASADHELLRTHGFSYEPPGQRAGAGFTEAAGPVYYGPDASVLFSGWFLDTHCFALAEASGDSLLIRFTPRGKVTAPEVSGVLVIDRGTMSLTRLGFRYEALPKWVPPGQAGGEVSFRRLPTGLWMVSGWNLRAPIRLDHLALRRGNRPQVELGGWAESGGRVVEVVER